MAKKASVMELEQIGEEKLIQEAEDQAAKPYTLGKWGNFRQWKCRFCPWDTLEGEETMMEHYRTVHAPPPESRARGVLVADRYGNPIE